MEGAANSKLRSIWLTVVASASVCLSAVLFYVGSRPGRLFGLLFFPLIAFTILAVAVRWLLLRSTAANALGRKLFLVVGGAKIALLLALVLLALECAIVAAVRPSARQEMVGTFISGMVAIVALSIALTGVANSIMVVRKLLKQ